MAPAGGSTMVGKSPEMRRRVLEKVGGGAGPAACVHTAGFLAEGGLGSAGHHLGTGKELAGVSPGLVGLPTFLTARGIHEEEADFDNEGHEFRLDKTGTSARG